MGQGGPYMREYQRMIQALTLMIVLVASAGITAGGTALAAATRDARYARLAQAYARGKSLPGAVRRIAARGNPRLLGLYALGDPADPAARIGFMETGSGQRARVLMVLASKDGILLGARIVEGTPLGAGESSFRNLDKDEDNRDPQAAELIREAERAATWIGKGGKV